MTDKQIIIDGVDVSGCGFYHSETGTECHIALAFAEEYTDDNHTYLKCEQNPNCYYKQLKAKEQECEAYKMETEEGEEINAELKAENDELKKKCNIYTCGICGNKEDCNKLYKTLTEIKEIIEQGVKIHDDIIVSKQILQKISECEGNDEYS